jgi:DNA-binding NtrC family response regulator
MKEHNTILYISGRADPSNSVLAALKETGCEVVSTSSPTEGLALLYVMHSVAAVVLDNRAREQASFDVAQSLWAIGPGVPIVLLCRDQIGRLPSCVDDCVGTGQPLENLTSEVQSLLTAKGNPAHSEQY